ncbi:MAG TPA: hypothetical protein VM659_28885 [Dongiaceae bacterium]|nr:hypothetical protein [Dongiaceae bacterium]
MSGLIKTGLATITGGTAAWLPYALVAALAAGGAGFGLWKLVVAPRLEAAALKVEKAEADLKIVTDANAETERSLRLQKAQADYDRQATASKLADLQAMADRAATAKKDISHVQGAQDAIDPVELYGNQRLRELRAARRGQVGNAIPVSP